MWDQFLMQKAAATVFVGVSHVLFIVSKGVQNETKVIILKANVQKFSRERAPLPSPTPPRWGGNTPFPHCPRCLRPLALNPLALKTWRCPLLRHGHYSSVYNNDTTLSYCISNHIFLHTGLQC